MAGNKLLVSNNPEQIEGLGWLFKNPTDLVSGNKVPNNFKFSLYLYHQNKLATQIYIHVIISNPNQFPINIDGKVDIYTINNFNGNMVVKKLLVTAKR